MTLTDRDNAPPTLAETDSLDQLASKDDHITSDEILRRWEAIYSAALLELERLRSGGGLRVGDWQGLSNEELDEFHELTDFIYQVGGVGDWDYDCDLIPESGWVDYVQELASDTAHEISLDDWPYYCIDWEYAARELHWGGDYSIVTVSAGSWYIRN